MKALKDEKKEPIKVGLDPKEMTIGNKFVDLNGEISEWKIGHYNWYFDGHEVTEENPVGDAYHLLKGVKINFKIAKAMGFKFPAVGKMGKKTGRLFIKANHYYLWRHDEPLRLEVSSLMYVDSDFMRQFLGNLKDANASEEIMEEAKKHLVASQAKSQMKMNTLITTVHQLQNHARELYNGHEIDVSKIK